MARFKTPALVYDMPTGDWVIVETRHPGDLMFYVAQELVLRPHEIKRHIQGFQVLPQFADLLFPNFPLFSTEKVHALSPRGPCLF
jgi:hypothetical protein